MNAIAGAIRAITAFNLALGRACAWLTVGVVVVAFAVVVQRYAFNAGQVWMQDLYVWLDGAMFTGVAGYAFARDGHVRVDIFYRPASPRYKAWVDLAGFFIFLLPFVGAVIHWSLPYVVQSWELHEGSRNTGGLPGLYLLKTFLLIFPLLLALQGIAFVGRSVLVLAGRADLVPANIRYRGA